MNTEEAIRRCDFWTTVASGAIGSTRDPEVGAFFEADSVPAEQFSDPNGARIWAIKIPDKVKDGPFSRENHAYKLVLEEIKRRSQ